jgi:hypothetical protein
VQWYLQEVELDFQALNSHRHHHKRSKIQEGKEETLIAVDSFLNTFKQVRANRS